MATSKRHITEDPRFRDRLHYHNMRRVNRDDIVLASYGGAGQTLLSNILLELGLNYVNPATEVLLPDGTSTPEQQSLSYRGRFAAVRARDTTGVGANRPGPRFVKTHMFPQEFTRHDIAGVWLLVRDPRDALYSYYKFRLEFPEVPWERLNGTFHEFLHELDYTGQRPVDDWSTFYLSWLDKSKHCRFGAVTRFEDLKRDGLATVRAALRVFDIEIPDDEIQDAVRRSSFDKMRAHEDTVADLDRDKGHARVMRKGKVGEWTEWMTPTLATYFTGDRVTTAAEHFGYGPLT